MHANYRTGLVLLAALVAQSAAVPFAAPAPTAAPDLSQAVARDSATNAVFVSNGKTITGEAAIQAGQQLQQQIQQQIQQQFGGNPFGGAGAAGGAGGSNPFANFGGFGGFPGFSKRDAAPGPAPTAAPDAKKAVARDNAFDAQFVSNGQTLTGQAAVDAGQQLQQQIQGQFGGNPFDGGNPFGGAAAGSSPFGDFGSFFSKRDAAPAPAPTAAPDASKAVARDNAFDAQFVSNGQTLTGQAAVDAGKQLQEQIQGQFGGNPFDGGNPFGDAAAGGNPFAAAGGAPGSGAAANPFGSFGDFGSFFSKRDAAPAPAPTAAPDASKAVARDSSFDAQFVSNGQTLTGEAALQAGQQLQSSIQQQIAQQFGGNPFDSGNPFAGFGTA